MSNLSQDVGAVVSAPPSLPPLPAVVRYFDHFEDCYRTLANLDADDVWHVHHDGGLRSMPFGYGPMRWHNQLLKLFIVDVLATRATATAVNYSQALNTIDGDLLRDIIEAIGRDLPSEFRLRWITDFWGRLKRGEQIPVRSLLQYCCTSNVGHWRTSDRDIVRALPGAPLDKYARVRSGECFIDLRDQSKLVDYLDQTAGRASEGTAHAQELRLAALLALSYQYGLRPSQLARLRVGSVRLFPSGKVHVTVELIKQRGQKRGSLVVRSIQQDWCVLFHCWFAGVQRPANERLFDLVPTEMTRTIRELTEEITDTPYSANDLRHTAAQRLVDGGASREMVAEFLGHSDISASDVYFESSAQQAELINQALGLSDIYRHVERAARTKTIDPDVLRQAPADQQVGGSPHGVPIAGIGLCAVGQSLCRRNPVLSCYTCHRFMPVKDENLHLQVLENLRGVVLSFARPNSVDVVSPAMLQARATLEAVQRLVVGTSDDA